MFIVIVRIHRSICCTRCSLTNLLSGLPWYFWVAYQSLNIDGRLNELRGMVSPVSCTATYEQSKPLFFWRFYYQSLRREPNLWPLVRRRVVLTSSLWIHESMIRHGIDALQIRHGFSGLQPSTILTRSCLPVPNKWEGEKETNKTDGLIWDRNDGVRERSDDQKGSMDLDHWMISHSVSTDRSPVYLVKVQVSKFQNAIHGCQVLENGCSCDMHFARQKLLQSTGHACRCCRLAV